MKKECQYCHHLKHHHHERHHHPVGRSILYARYDNVTLIPLVLQLGLRIGPIQREYFNFLFAYLVITYYSLQFLSNCDTK